MHGAPSLATTQPITACCIIQDEVQDGDQDAALQDNDTDAPTTSAAPGSSTGFRKIVRVPRQPLLSDPLSPPTGPVQGLSWFFDSFFRDEWGHVANVILDAVHGQLVRAKQRVVASTALQHDSPPDPLSVRLRRRRAAGAGVP